MNRVHIEPCEFKDTRTGKVTRGVRVFDDAGQTYDNSWDDIPDDDMEVLRRVIDTDDYVVELLRYVVINHKEVYIGPWEYSWDEIQHLFPDQ